MANFRYDDFPAAIDLLEEGGIRTEGMVTHRFPLREAVEAFRVAGQKDRTGAIKVVLRP